MSLLAWNESYSVGVASIDDEHRELFDAVRNLESAIVRNAEAAETGPLLLKLAEATARHFQDEEAIMRKAKYPGMALHVANHERLVEKIDAFAVRHSRGGAPLNQHALNFLHDWLLHHIESDDARLGEWLNEHKPG
jgi:hemerythrin